MPNPIKVTISIEVTHGYDTPVQISESRTVPMVLRQPGDPPAPTGYQDARGTLMDLAEYALSEAGDQLMGYHDQDLTRLTREQAKWEADHAN